MSKCLQIYPLSSFGDHRRKGSGDANPYNLLSEYLRKVELTALIAHIGKSTLIFYRNW